VSEEGYRRTTPGMRAILWIGAVLVTAAGSQLYLLSEDTDRFFAWTIAVPLTAAFLGAFYFTALGFAVESARQTEWSRARVGVPGVTVFLWMTLVATLLHLDLFHLTADSGVARGAAWLWLAIYALDPPALTVLWFLQTRVPGRDRPRSRPLPSWYRVLLAAEGTLTVTVGTVLFLVPSTAAHVWPWPLTPLTAQTTAAWLAGYGIVLLTMIVENDWGRVGPALVPSIVLVVLQTVALLRYPDPVDWSSPTAWIFLAVLGATLLLGVSGTLLARTGRSGTAG
jgi:hypothetical protein